MAQIGTQDWTRTRLSPHKARIWRCLKSGISRYNRLSPDDRLAFGGRCQSDVLNAFVIFEARKEFDGVKDSEFVDRNNTTYHSLNGCVLWYKQLNEDRRPSNIPTLAIDQMMQGQFDFMPNKLLMVVGFELDAFKSQLKSVDLMRFGPGHRIEFIIELTEVEVQPRVMQMVPKGEPAVPRRTKIALRNGFEQKALVSRNE
jgi:hypothetical protein